MLLRTPSILVAASASLQSAPPTFATSSTSWQQVRPKSTRRPREHPRTLQQVRKTYATITDEHDALHDAHEPDTHTWPTPPSGQSHPTPYQILSMHHTTTTYTKTRFHELVKVYHPDRGTTSSSHLSPAVKTERYRLIVAAHTILSDPSKRSAYDRFGAGWNGRAENIGGPHNRSSSGQPGPFSQSWASDHPYDPSIWQNATWEDWQRFYARRDGRDTGEQKQSPLYLQNSYFIVLVGVLALMGSTANYSRAQDAGIELVEQRDAVHDRAAKALRNVKREAGKSGNKDDRIEWFVRNREATLGVAGSDEEVLERERVEKVLPDREVCRSERVGGQEVNGAGEG